MKKIFTAQTIGRIAWEALSQETSPGRLSILGITSHGLFLEVISGRVIFLTTTDRRGPLTLNLVGESTWLVRINRKTSVQITADGKLLLGNEFQILTHEAEIWQSPDRSGLTQGNRILSPHERNNRMETLVRQVSTQKGIRFLSGEEWISKILFAEESVIGMSNGIFRTYIERLRTALTKKQVSEIAGACESLIGWGSGLTPQGDDIILGLLLTFNRWGDVLVPDLNVPNLNQEVFSLINERTTALSTSLIECATFGQAEECLICGLDGIMAGRDENELDHEIGDLAQNFTSWGSSSGIAVLAGISLALGFR
jgi:hypothetical protein